MRNVTLRQLRAVTAVGASRKIVRAARELNLTPPAITLQLQQIEAEAGFALFDRTSDGLRPTDAGQIVLETAAEVWSLLAACEDRLAALRGVTAGRVSIGVVSTAKYFAPRLIASFAKLRPGVGVRLRVGNREEIVDLLRSFQIDLAIMGAPPDDVPVEASLLGDHPLIIVAAPDHRLAARCGLERGALADEVFLTREEGSGTRISMESYLGGTTGLRIEMGSNETIKQAVMAGLGIAFISAHTTAAELESGRLATLDIEGLPVRRQWFVVRRSDRALMPAGQAFAEFLNVEGARSLPAYPPLVRGSQP